MQLRGRSNQAMSRSMVGWVLVGVQVIVFLVLILLPWRQPTPLSLASGIALALCGIALAVSSMRTLGRALTPTPVPIEGAGLRTSGSYRFVRHPIYSALLLVTLGFIVAVGSLASLAWAVVIVGFFWGKSRWEDSLLREIYPGEWDAWASRTGALIPRLQRTARST
jgi:protein-S-isoprenylcysteine O-methyltransferase Ste14